MTVGIYMQVDRFFPPEITQRTAINKWLAQHNIPSWSVQWFIDRESKSEFKQLFEDIKNGSIKTVVLYSLEQAFPSIASITTALCDFSTRNMKFASASQDIYFDQESLKSAHLLISVVLGLADHHYRVRQQQGIVKARAKGLYKGKKPGANKVGVDIKKAVRLRERGFPIKRIAEKMGVCESSVHRYLRISKAK